ncbi:hypothetical protein O9992_01435 [Vibrio lentus]|nr:hypothetical protein [Vibrio lentus]
MCHTRLILARFMCSSYRYNLVSTLSLATVAGLCVSRCQQVGRA